MQTTKIDNATLDLISAEWWLDYDAACVAEGLRSPYAADGISSDPAHGGTHGPGGIDSHGSSYFPGNTKAGDALVVAMAEVGREMGAAMWPRGLSGIAASGRYKRHGHLIIGGHPWLSREAELQYEAYLDGYNGLGAGFRGAKDYCTRRFVGRKWDRLDEVVAKITGTSPAATTHRVIGAPSSDPLNVRSGPGLGYGIDTTVTTGTPVHLLVNEGRWAQVRFTDTGRVGWVSTSYIRKV